jgi:polyisoprenyl-phosphate glycosyltransferase
MNKLLSLIVPVYFEEECINQFIKETVDVLVQSSINYEIIFIDDGSRDMTVKLIQDAIKINPNLKLIELSYNHGKQAALTAGITYSKGDFLLMMDPDLQDPPVEIPKFIEEIEKGYDLVFGIREEKKDTFLNKIFSKLFWWVLEKFTGLKIPKGLAVMRIFNRKFANKFLEYREQNRFIEGIFMLIGMKWTTLNISQRERFAGFSKFNFSRKMQLAFNAIFDFSELPLKVTIRFGVFLISLSLFAILILILIKLFLVDFQMGWPSLMITLILGIGLQIFFLGIIGQYIGKVYKESKQRPLFSIKELNNIN